MRQVEISGDTIRLSQFLKLADVVGSGVEAKFLITDGEVLVNEQSETRRGRKLRDGDRVRVGNEIFLVVEREG
ncbi:MAG: RNA-binding S4 domain-containing protein [Desulfobulbaceae bacterium]|nr:RNA-binding S4 domain-containing protein [Desulfobulbaceae bacterium]